MPTSRSARFCCFFSFLRSFLRGTPARGLSTSLAGTSPPVLRVADRRTRNTSSARLEAKESAADEAAAGAAPGIGMRFLSLAFRPARPRPLIGAGSRTAGGGVAAGAGGCGVAAGA